MWLHNFLFVKSETKTKKLLESNVLVLFSRHTKTGYNNIFTSYYNWRSGKRLADPCSQKSSDKVWFKKFFST